MSRVRFNRLAASELAEAVERYEAEREGLGHEFLDQIYRSFELLLRFPKSAQVARGSVRAFVVSRFPYSILYRSLENGDLRILAISHHKRRPGYWSDRR